jgi:hypothetical protein
MTTELSATSVTHAHIKRILHPRLGVEVDGRTCVRTLRFRRRVKIEHLELKRPACGRWWPTVPTQPAHLLVSVLDGKQWRVVKEVDVPRDPRVAGDTDICPSDAEVEEFQKRSWPVFNESLRIELGGLETDHVRVECDREHSPIKPNHGEMGSGAAGYAVPFKILSQLTAHGEQLAAAPDTSVYYQPILAVGTVEPRAPQGMKVRKHLHNIVFEGKHLSVGFSLRRPLLTHLGWDAEGFGQARRNRLVTRRLDLWLSRSEASGASGPIVRTTAIDCACSHWSGEVCVEGNRVCYRNLRSSAGVLLDAVFTVEPRRILVELTQRAEQDTPVLEAEAWRLTWDLKKAMTATAAMPTRRELRAGDVQMPALFATDAGGCLACSVLEGPADAVRLQVESYKDSAVNTAGIVLGTPPAAGAPLVVSREPVRAVIEWEVTNLEPVATGRRGKPSPAIRKHWASLFSNFRSEYAGFSNHGASTNCHNQQRASIDAAVFTARPAKGPDPVELARFTIERGLLDGSGYGYHRSLYLDADPILLASAGRIHQAQPDKAWLTRVRPGLVEAARRILDTMAPEGLAVCCHLSGNSGSQTMSSNACDQVGFGHMDAYVNVWTYRALRNAAVLLREAGDADLARRCRDTALAMREPFARYLVNPDTGWVAGWRSRDGQLHDYAFTFINAPACAFGILDTAAAKRALAGLEALRIKMGLTYAPHGVPFNLLPIAEADQPRHVSAATTASHFELFCNGSCASEDMGYYVRALATHGFKASARKLARDMEEAFFANVFSPGMSEGAEFFSWEGLSCGYEGTFGPNFGAFYGIAIERGLFTPPDPEWWPAE